MMARPKRLSTAIACAFIATSTAPLAIPRRTSAIAKVGRLGASNGAGMASMSASIAAVVVFRLPKQTVSRPLDDSPTNEPVAMQSRANPSELSVRPSACLASGICGTQLPSAAPLAKKTQPVAKRAREVLSTQALAKKAIDWLPAIRLTCGVAPGPLQPPPCFEHTGDRPGLRRRATWRVRRVAVEDLANMAERAVGEMVGYRLEPGLRRGGIAMHPVMRQHPMSEQPSPDRPLVVAAVALSDAATVMTAVVGV